MPRSLGVHVRDRRKSIRARASRVAVDEGAVAGLVQLQSDGEIQAHLSALLVGEAWRGRGISRRLLREALQRAGGMRMDILSAAETFYRHLGAESKTGFRLRPPDLE